MGKFGPKCQNYQFKLKFGSYSNSNMQNSMMLFTFFIFDQECTFWANLVQIVTVSLRWNLITRLIWICKIQWQCSLFFNWKHPFWANLVHNIKIVSLRLNLVVSLIRICRNTVFVQISSKMSKLLAEAEIWYLD